MDCEYLLSVLMHFNFVFCDFDTLGFYISVHNQNIFCLLKKPGARVLYLGAASGTTVSHVSDIVGPVSPLYDIVVFISFSILESIS